jgi:hypothetical protein
MRTGSVYRLALASVVLMVVLASCATSQLEYYEFDGESMRLRVIVSRNARVSADYFVNIDPEHPIVTILSIGTSVAKASQVEQAQDLVDSASRRLDVGRILEEELSAYYEDAFDMKIVDSSHRATYEMSVEVDSYGIEASGADSSVEFHISGVARIYDAQRRERIWRDRFSEYIPISPSVFGLPGSAGNVLSAAMLSDLTEEEVAWGLEQVTRNAAWEVASEFDRDFYRRRW